MQIIIIYFPICSRDFWCFRDFSATNISSAEYFMLPSLPQLISNGPREDDGSITAADHPGDQDAGTSSPVKTLEPVVEDPKSPKARTIQI